MNLVVYCARGILRIMLAGGYSSFALVGKAG